MLSTKAIYQISINNYFHNKDNEPQFYINKDYDLKHLISIALYFAELSQYNLVQIKFVNGKSITLNICFNHNEIPTFDRFLDLIEIDIRKQKYEQEHPLDSLIF